MRVGTKILSTVVLSSGLIASWSMGSRHVATELVLSEEPLVAPVANTSLQPETDLETASSTDSEDPAVETQAPAEAANSSSAADPETAEQAPTQTSNAPEAPAAPSPPPSPSQSQSETSATPSIEAPPEVQILTIDSDPIDYKYGILQLRLVTSDGLISEISVLQGDLSFGRDAAYQALADATIQVQGTNYGNISGSTFTVNAYKAAVTNALAKR